MGVFWQNAAETWVDVRSTVAEKVPCHVGTHCKTFNIFTFYILLIVELTVMSKTAYIDNVCNLVLK